MQTPRIVFIVSAVLTGILFSGSLAFAQQNSSQTTMTTPIDDTRLISLYEQYVKRDFHDAYLATRIDDERKRIRAVIERDLASFISGEKGATDTVATDLGQAISRQKAVITTLEASNRERSADLDQLKEEEKKFYLTGSSASLSPDTPRITHTYGELLAKKAILQERIGGLDSVIPLQKEKLKKLTYDQQLEQFALLIRLLTYAGILLVIIFIERSVQRLIVARIRDRNRRYFVKKMLSSIVYVTAGLWLFLRLFSFYPNAASAIAIVGAGLAVALQDLVKDIMGWLLIIQKRYFTLGDRIAIGDYAGDIIDIGLFRTAMLEVGTTNGRTDVLERTGKTIYFPNSLALTQQVLNYNTTSDFTKAELQIGITFESHWQKAETIMADILQKHTTEHTKRARAQHHARTHLFYMSNEPTAGQIYMDIASSGIVFTLRFNVPIGFRRDVITAINRDILTLFAKEPDITLAYTTMRVINDPLLVSRLTDAHASRQTS